MAKPRSIRFPDHLVERIDALGSGSFHSNVLDLVSEALDARGPEGSGRVPSRGRQAPAAALRVSRPIDREFRPDFGSKLSK